MIRPGIGPLPQWALDLLPRLDVQLDRWADSQSRGGLISGNVLPAHTTRSALPELRMPSDKSGLFRIMEEAVYNKVVGLRAKTLDHPGKWRGSAPCIAVEACQIVSHGDQALPQTGRRQGFKNSGGRLTH